MSITISSTETADQIAAAQIAASEPVEASEVPAEAKAPEADEVKAAKGEAEKPEEDKIEEGKDDTEVDEDKAVEAGEANKSSGRTRNRVQKLRARTEALEQELIELRAKMAQPKEVEKEHVADTSGRPNPDNFETEEDYQDALAEWRVDQKLAAREQKAKSEKLTSEFQERLQTHRQKTAEFAKQHADFEEVIEAVSDIELSPVIQSAILENGPEFMYELAKNPEELEKINELSAFEAARALGRIEERIAARAVKPKEEKKIQTKAPQPISTTRSGAGTASYKSIYDEGLSFAEYEKLRSAQLKEAR